MTTFTRADDLGGAQFAGVNLRGARFVESDLSGVVMRGVDVEGADIDAPWLLESGAGSLRVNGVELAAFVDAELDRRFPGRELRCAQDPDGLRAAWAAVERTWGATVARAAAMPSGTVDVRVDGEWSFAQTLRHLVMATDTWLRGAVLGVERPFHPIGQPDDGYAAGGGDLSIFSGEQPTFKEVLEVRAGRVELVRDFLATVTADDLTVPRVNPWFAGQPETTLSCLRTIVEEEWEHHRFAVRDLDAIAAGAGS
jgi:hypothetical protein